MKALPLFALACTLLITGCETRSISDSGYRPAYAMGRPANPLYKGELSEFDVLGLAARGDASEANIARTLANAAPPRLKRGDAVLLIQSGAPMPDNSMLDAIAPYFPVAPFSGIPPGEKTAAAESSRLRAAQGGYRYIVCYWGVLESAQTDREGKAVSWVPIMGAFVPDQKQQMRLRLKALLVDVASGHWRMFTPEAYSDTRFNSAWTRESADQRLVLSLKAKAYQNLVAELVKG